MTMFEEEEEIFTDVNGNPIEVDNHPARKGRSAEDIAHHVQRVSERPTRPTRKEEKEEKRGK